MHANQFLVGVASLVSEILPSFYLPSKQPNFPFGPWTIVHGGQKIESAQNFYASRGGYEMLIHQVLWALGRGIPPFSLYMYVHSVCLFIPFISSLSFPSLCLLSLPISSLPPSLSLPLSLLSLSLSLSLTGNRNGLLVPNTTTDQVTHNYHITLIIIIIIIIIIIMLLGVAAFT